MANTRQHGLKNWRKRPKKHNPNYPFFFRKSGDLDKGVQKVKNVVKEEIENFQKCFKAYGAKTIHNLLAAFLVWLFGNLVFIPLASTLNWQTKVFCSLIFFIVFTLLVTRALPGLKRLIDTFSIFPARKYSIKKKLSYENSLILFQHILYIFSIIIIYLLYFPFLTNFHPSISGIVLILVIIWIFFLTLRILTILSQKIVEWLCT